MNLRRQREGFSSIALSSWPPVSSRALCAHASGHQVDVSTWHGEPPCRLTCRGRTHCKRLLRHLHGWNGSKTRDAPAHYNDMPVNPCLPVRVSDIHTTSGSSDLAVHGVGLASLSTCICMFPTGFAGTSFARLLHRRPEPLTRLASDEYVQYTCIW